MNTNLIQTKIYTTDLTLTSREAFNKFKEVKELRSTSELLSAVFDFVLGGDKTRLLGLKGLVHKNCYATLLSDDARKALEAENTHLKDKLKLTQSSDLSKSCDDTKILIEDMLAGYVSDLDLTKIDAFCALSQKVSAMTLLLHTITNQLTNSSLSIDLSSSKLSDANINSSDMPSCDTDSVISAKEHGLNECIDGSKPEIVTALETDSDIANLEYSEAEIVKEEVYIHNADELHEDESKVVKFKLNISGLTTPKSDPTPDLTASDAPFSVEDMKLQIVSNLSKLNEPVSNATEITKSESLDIKHLKSSKVLTAEQLAQVKKAYSSIDSFCMNTAALTDETLYRIRHVLSDYPAVQRDDILSKYGSELTSCIYDTINYDSSKNTWIFPLTEKIDIKTSEFVNPPGSVSIDMFKPALQLAEETDDIELIKSIMLSGGFTVEDMRGAIKASTIDKLLK